LALAVVFLWAAYAKLQPIGSAPWTLDSLKITRSSLSLSLTYFAMQIDSYQILPSWAVIALAHVLPWTELGLGILLAAGLAQGWVGLAAAGLMATMFGVVLHTYLVGLQINCGCFGPSEPLTRMTIFRDGLLLALAAAVSVGGFLRGRSSPDSAAGVTADNGDAAIAGS
jgi:uncharacterized membrane protein YphA (DoxX/SURF4 family)